MATSSNHTILNIGRPDRSIRIMKSLVLGLFGLNDSDVTLADRLGELRITSDEIAEQLHLPTAANGSAGTD